MSAESAAVMPAPPLPPTIAKQAKIRPPVAAPPGPIRTRPEADPALPETCECDSLPDMCGTESLSNESDHRATVVSGETDAYGARGARRGGGAAAGAGGGRGSGEPGLEVG